MTPTSSRRTSRLVACSLLVSLLGLTACTGDDGLDEAIGNLVASIEDHEVRGFDEVAEALAEYPVEATAVEPVRDGDTATVEVAVSWDIDGNEWSYELPVALEQIEGEWSVDMTPQLIADGLEEGEVIEVSREYPARADIAGAGGEAIVTERPVTRYGLDKSWIDPGQTERSARRIARALGVDPDELASRADQMGDQAFVEAIVLRPDDAKERVPADYSDIPGANAVDDTMFLAPTREFARDILGTVGEATAEMIEESEGALRAGDVVGLSGLQAAHDEALRGIPAVTVSAASGEGDDAERRTLVEWDAVEAEPLATTLDVKTQQRADAVLADVPGGSSLVAIRPSTGEVLAAANGPETEVHAAATVGQYAPGSTFKIVTALALLRQGLTPDDTVSCSETLTVDDFEFHNFPDYPADKTDDITLRDAIAHSCNTAMIAQRADLDQAAVQDAAAALGLGVDADVGIPAFLGDIPEPDGETAHAASLIGQGAVLTSPLAMATVAASIAAGQTVAPSVLAEPAEADAAASPAPTESAAPEETSTPSAAPLTHDEASTLRALMRSVVVDGSASELKALEPAVAAKTGTAEFGEPDADGDLSTHAWMIAVQDDLAVAVFVADGPSGSDTAGPIMADFLGRM